MVEAALVGLAMAGATTLVAAMATDAWQATRDGVLGLFHRDGQAQQVALLAQADGNAARVEQCEDRDSARQRLIPLWQGELEEFLSRHPDAAADLRSLTQRVRAQLPETQLSWVQNVTASGEAMRTARRVPIALCRYTMPVRDMFPRPRRLQEQSPMSDLSGLSDLGSAANRLPPRPGFDVIRGF